MYSRPPGTPPRRKSGMDQAAVLRQIPSLRGGSWSPTWIDLYKINHFERRGEKLWRHLGRRGAFGETNCFRREKKGSKRKLPFPLSPVLRRPSAGVNLVSGVV